MTWKTGCIALATAVLPCVPLSGIWKDAGFDSALYRRSYLPLNTGSRFSMKAFTPSM